jgi:hypothetical protein
MPAISNGSIHAFYLFDVAESIDLGAVGRALGSHAASARVHDKAPGPPRIRYLQAPVVVEGAAFDLAEVDGFRVRVKFYDYGVVSLRLARPFAGSWGELVRLGQVLIESEPLEEHALEACRKVVARLQGPLDGVRSRFLAEDYLTFVVTGLDAPATGDDLLATHGDDIAQLLRGERQTLSPQERDEVLRHRISYLTDDLVVPAWNGAFVYDTDAGAMATLEILEFVNSQLLEFRYYDERLDSELTRIYATLQQPRRTDWIVGRRYSRAARQLQSAFIDVNELTDRLENALKLVGDLYAARLANLASARLGIDTWRRSVKEKLDTLDDIYRFAVEQTGMSQGNILELTIVLILVLELALFFLGIMR